MIYGIGADIVQVSRIQSGLERFGESFARRILGEGKLPEFRTSSRQAHFLAKHFAAKEAVAKAIGTGFRDGMKLCDIAVVHDHVGRPGLSFSGRTGQMLKEIGVVESHLSLADEHDYALAFVVLLTAGNRSLA